MCKEHIKKETNKETITKNNKEGIKSRSKQRRNN